MRILVFGKNKKPRSAPGKVTKSLAIETYPISDLASMVPSLQDGTLVYLDLEGLGGPQREKVLTVIPDNPHLLFGVVDPTGFVADVAALFHVGAVDYIGRKMRGNRLNARRVSQVLSFADGAGVLEDERGGGDGRDGAPSSLQLPRPAAEGALSDGWSRIVPGKEYQFAILFVEVDGAEEMKKKHEPENLAGAMESFRGFVERMAAQHGGRTWMWSQFGGLALFPVKNAAGASLCGLRLFLSRIFYDVEESILPGHISFHMALSMGTTVYRERDTGEIISETLNAVFHLGKRYTRPGQFFLTAGAMETVPQKLKGLCVPVGTYEGRRIFRLNPPRPSYA